MEYTQTSTAEAEFNYIVTDVNEQDPIYNK